MTVILTWKDPLDPDLKRLREESCGMEKDTQNIKSILFDLDGTLIDSVPAYHRAMESILKIVGLRP